MYAPAGYAITFVSVFAVYTSTIVHALLFYHPQMYEGLRSTLDPKRRAKKINDLHSRLMAKYPGVQNLFNLELTYKVPQWWYILTYIISFVMGIVALAVYVPEVPKWVSFLFHSQLTVSCCHS